MLMTLVIGVLGTFALCLVASVAFMAWDEEPEVHNLRALRARAEAAAAASSADLEAPAYDDLEAAA